MSDMYAIKTSTLTALGDAVREKTGKTTKVEYMPLENNPTHIIIDTETLDVSNLPIKSGCYQYQQDIILPGVASYVITGTFDTSKGDTTGTCGVYKYNADATTTYVGNLKTVLAGAPISAPYGLVLKTDIQTATHNNNKYFTLDLTITGYDSEGNLVLTYPIDVINTMTLSQMTEEITALSTAADVADKIPTDAELLLTGDCSYKFYRLWDWFLEKYGDRIRTEAISDATNMFYGSMLSKIPIDGINMNTALNYTNTKYMFSNCTKLVELPRVLNLKPYDMGNMFNNCYSLEEIPDDFYDTWDWSYLESQTGSYNGGQAYLFQNCYRLKQLPMKMLQHGNPYQGYSNCMFYYGFNSCYHLREIVDLPIIYKGSWTNNGLNNTVGSCWSLRRFTFAPIEISLNWSKQTLDCSSYTGWAQYNLSLSNYGGTADEAQYEIIDDATYQALKDHPDSWTRNVAYSRYNHDSAVETINSLPTVSGTNNIIKFKGAAGSLTDGGAINTLTDEEIAVAAAKGWTVSFV